jgi:hypothetical protein
MKHLARNVLSAIYGSLLFLPGGIPILVTVIAIKALKAGNFSQFKIELKKMIKPEISNN